MTISSEQANAFLESVGINPTDISKIIPQVSNPLVLPSELGVSARVLHYWRKKDY